MAESERRVSAIHQSLTQPILLAGAERPLAIANWITAAALILGGGLHWYTIAMGAFLLTVGHWALVQAAKFDPSAQPGLRPARPLPGLLSGSRLGYRAALTNPAVRAHTQGDPRVTVERLEHGSQRVQGFKT